MKKFAALLIVLSAGLFSFGCGGDAKKDAKKDAKAPAAGAKEEPKKEEPKADAPKAEEPKKEEAAK